jgi:SRSO17 transposase
MASGGAEAERFEEYLARLYEAVGHADRREPLKAYLSGLLLPGERKSVEPMAAKIDPRLAWARAISRCITWWPRPPGRRRRSCGWPATMR